MANGREMLMANRTAMMGGSATPPTPTFGGIKFVLEGVTAGASRTEYAWCCVTLADGGSWNVDWGDGTTETGLTTTPLPSHTYADAGSYDLIIDGDIVSFRGGANGRVIRYSFLRFDSYLKQVVFGECDITSLGIYCFYGCTGLTSVTIPSSVTSLGNSCFYGCTGLTSVTIPEGVTSLGSSCFYGCSGLTSITSEATTPPSVGSDCFYNVPTTIPVYVPSASIAAYQAASGWSDFTNYQAIPE